MKKALLYINTIKYLKLNQIYYRIFYFIRNKLFTINYSKSLPNKIETIDWYNHIYHQTSFKNNTFTFLNISHTFDNTIDWNYKQYGKLWTYNLNYFDYLNQHSIELNTGLNLINSFIRQKDFIKDGKEPYPISLRGINWIKFLSINKFENKQINQKLYNDYQHLLHNIEYHLLGNHLLENAFSLFFGAYYFKDDNLYYKAKKILKNELEKQILKDGAHFELSPMYHKILLHRLLDCIYLIQLNSWKGEELVPFFNDKATAMLSWLKTVTYSNGDTPMVNDSTYAIAPISNELFYYADKLGLIISESKLNDSGYRMIKNDNYEFFIDVGKIGPSFQPGHAHADTFSFEFYYNELPFIVDTGISTYEPNHIRFHERSTSSHNTVEINNKNQSQIWGSFRVAKRAKVFNLIEKNNYIKASHDGYKKMGITHTREFSFDKKKILIIDHVNATKNDKQIFHIHFHPNIKSVDIKNNVVLFAENNLKIIFKNPVEIKKTKYMYAEGFNKLRQAYSLKVYFCNLLETSIEL